VTWACAAAVLGMPATATCSRLCARDTTVRESPAARRSNRSALAGTAEEEGGWGGEGTDLLSHMKRCGGDRRSIRSHVGRHHVCAEPVPKLQQYSAHRPWPAACPIPVPTGAATMLACARDEVRELSTPYSALSRVSRTHRGCPRGTIALRPTRLRIRTIVLG
jgi:hypothetical protein